MKWVIDELDEFEHRDGDVFYITEENKEKLRSIAPFWEHNTLLDRGLAAFPPHSKLYYDLGIIKSEGNITSGDAHCAVDYGRMMRVGLKDYERRAMEKLEKLDLTDYRNIQKSYFYRAILITVQGVKHFAERYAELAEQTAGREADPVRRAELLSLIHIFGNARVHGHGRVAAVGLDVVQAGVDDAVDVNGGGAGRHGGERRCGHGMYVPYKE